MGDTTIEARVAKLENDVNLLRNLPAVVEGVQRDVKELVVRVSGVEVRLSGVELQIVQLRTDMSDGFSAIRGEMGAMKAELKGEMGAMKAELQEDIAAQGRETAAGFLELGREMRTVHTKLDQLLESPRRPKR